MRSFYVGYFQAGAARYRGSCQFKKRDSFRNGCHGKNGANDYFVELSGYPEAELIGKSHNIVRHPDMPKTVFKLLWDALKAGKEYKAIVKNRRKDGKYYWVYSEYKPLLDDKKTSRRSMQSCWTWS